ncbi:hypothetical protein Lal_00044765 [Lupinus albus]|nr:hypothetical protein Lal_00044765 [Lupinus albus]
MVSHIWRINPTYPKQVREEEEELVTREQSSGSRSSEPILAQASPFSLKLAHSRSSENLTSDSIDRSESNDIEALQGLTVEFLISLRTLGLPNYKIKLKTEGFCNGAIMIVNRLSTHVIEAKVMTGKNVGKIFYIPRSSYIFIIFIM